jgi:phage terminase large subunit-like protein
MEARAKLAPRGVTGTAKYAPHKPWPKQQLFLDIDDQEAFFGGAAGGGKALAVDTWLPTPTGWVQMGDVKPGDILFADDGNPCEVLACSEVMHNNSCFEVEFSDGSTIIADGGHLWSTLTLADRNAATRRTDEYRAKRRAIRKSRSTGKKPWVIERNQAIEHAVLEPPTSSPKTTCEILETLTHNGRTNHSVKVAGALQLPTSDLPIHPYVLGAWLGDGHSIGAGFTCNDPELIDEIRKHGHEVTKHSSTYGYGILGLYRPLRITGLLKNKHIPEQYLRACEDDRWALLQGLMDTDGHACVKGHCEFTTTSPVLRDGVLELILSLGIKANAKEGVAKLNGRVIGPKWRIKFVAEKPAFRLQRKLERQKLSGYRGTHSVRYITKVTRVPSVPVRCVQVDSPSHCYLAGRSMIPTHNSDTLLMAALEYAHLPNYAALILRRDFPRLSLPGSIMDRAKAWLYNSDAEWNESRKMFRFPSGAIIQFGYIDNPDDRFRYASSEFQFIGWDELTEFALPSEQNGEANDANVYLFMFSRLRKTEDNPIPLRVRSASNPGNAGHAFVKGRFISPEAEKDLLEGNPKDLYFQEGRAFVPSKIKDNPAINEDEYSKNLSHLPPVTRLRLMNGDWSVSVAGLIKYEWLRYFTMKGDYIEPRDSGGNVIALIDQRDCRRFITIDPAGTSAEKAKESKGKPHSWTVAGVWDQPPSRFGRKLILRHVWRARVDFPGLLQGIRNIHKEWKPTRILIENEKYGEAAVSMLQGELPISTTATGGKDKVTRAAPLLNMMERGEVFLPKYDAGWKQPLEAEWLSWQGLDEETCDQVDMASYAAIEVTAGGSGTVAVDHAFWEPQGIPGVRF